MFDRILKWAERKVAETETHRRSVGAKSTAHGTMEVKSRKFTGRYECGLEVDRNVLQPDECPVHGENCTKVYEEWTGVETHSVAVKGA